MDSTQSLRQSAATYGLTLEAYQGIRAAVAEELASNRRAKVVSCSTAAGAVSTRRQDSPGPEGTIFVSGIKVSCYKICEVVILISNFYAELVHHKL
jgi:hypothetical protein